MKVFISLVAAIVATISFIFPIQSKSPTEILPQGGPVHAITIAENSAADYSQSSVAYANNLSTYFVTYRSSLNQILVTKILPNGVNAGAFFAAGGRDYYSRSAPDLAYNTVHHQILVVWEDLSTDGTNITSIRGRIFDQSGTPVTDEFPICAGLVGAQCYHPAVAYSVVQDRYLVVWQRTSGPEASGDIEGMFVTSAGGVELYIPVHLAGSNMSFGQPDVAFNHIRNEYLVAFQLVDCNTNPCNRDILGHRINYLGEVLDGSFGIMIGYKSIPESHPSVAAYPDVTGTECWMVAWTAEYAPDPLDRDVYNNLMDCDGIPQLGTGAGLVATGFDDYNPAIAFNGNRHRYLAVWQLTTNAFLNTSSIIGMEVTPGGLAAGVPKFMGGWYATQAAVAAGPYGDYLASYTESVLFGRQQILGTLWGQRIFMPLIKK